MLRISLEQWRMFRAVVEFGGFNQAAEGVHKSQSSIHTAVSKIEQSLGVKLFVVQGRKTQLTEAGRLMLRRANYLLDEAHKIESVGQALGQGVESVLKIAVDEVFPLRSLYQVFNQTSHLYPLLQIELIESVLSGANELLVNKEVDLAIGPSIVKGGFGELLYKQTFIAVAHPDHNLHRLGRELSLEDLKSERQIVVRDSGASRKDAGWLGSDQRWTVSHMRTSVDIICQGLGFAWLPANYIEEFLASGQLKPLKLSYAGTRLVTLYLTYQDFDKLGPAARTLVELLREQCKTEHLKGEVKEEN